MRLRCERDILVDALVTTGRAASSRTGVSQALLGIHLTLTGNELALAGTDYDLTIRARVGVAGMVDGACVVPSRLTSDIVRALEPGAVVIEVEDEEARISSGRSQFTIRTYAEAEFPHLAAPSGQAVVLAGAELTEAMRQVVRAASGDDARPMLTGVLMASEGEGLRLVATDSYRLAVRDLAGTTVLAEGQQVLVPARALAELARLLAASSGLAAAPASSTPGAEGRPVTLRIGEHDATFDVGAVTLTTRLLEWDFPPYRSLIPASYPNRLVVGKEPLLDALRRVKLLVRDATSPVRLSMRPDGVQLTSSTPEIGQALEDVEAKYEGAELTVAFNPTYLMEGVEAVTGDEVMIETLDAVKPATVRANEADPYRYLLMPVRVS